MSILKINRQALQAPVINTENGELLGRSSIAVFRREDLSLAQLIVNSLPNEENEATQMIIPFSDIISLNQYSISVRFSPEEQVEAEEPCADSPDEEPQPDVYDGWQEETQSAAYGDYQEETEDLTDYQEEPAEDEYIRLVGEPIRQPETAESIITELTVNTAGGELITVTAEGDGQQNTYTRDQLTIVDGMCAVIVEEPEEEPDEAELKFNRLESLIENISLQLATLNERMLSLKDDKESKAAPEEDLPGADADNAQDPNALLLGRVDNIAEMLETIIGKEKNTEPETADMISEAITEEPFDEEAEDFEEDQSEEEPFDEYIEDDEPADDPVSEWPEEPEREPFGYENIFDADVIAFLNELKEKAEADNAAEEEDENQITFTDLYQAQESENDPADEPGEETEKELPEEVGDEADAEAASEPEEEIEEAAEEEEPSVMDIPSIEIPLFENAEETAEVEIPPVEIPEFELEGEEEEEELPEAVEDELSEVGKRLYFEGDEPEKMQAEEETQPEEEDSDNEELLLSTPLELQQPLTLGGDVKEEKPEDRIHIGDDSFVDVMAESEAEPQFNGEVTSNAPVMTHTNRAGQSTREQAPAKRTSFWKICGLQVLGGILFIGACIAMNYFGI